MTSTKYKASAYLSPEESELLETIASDYGISKSKVINLAIQTLALIPPDENPAITGNPKFRGGNSTAPVSEAKVIELINQALRSIRIRLDRLEEESLSSAPENNSGGVNRKNLAAIFDDDD